MKTLLITLLSLAALSAFAGPEPSPVVPPAPDTSYFGTGFELGLTGNGSWTQTAWRNDRYTGSDKFFGGGLFANYFFTQNLGLGLSFNGYAVTAKGEQLASDTRFIGTVPVNVIFRYPIGQWAPFIYAGAGVIFNGGNSTVTEPSGTPGKKIRFERLEHDVKMVAPMGAGVEYRLNSKWGVIAEGEFDKVDRPQSNFFTSKVGLSYSF